jgi:hypothetical protein
MGKKFDPESSDFDYESAKKAGMKPTIDPKDGKPHWGSVVPATQQEKEKHSLPKGSYKIVKGKKHNTYWKAEDAEKSRGANVVKKGDRYYSVPGIHMSEKNKMKKGGMVKCKRDGICVRGITKGRFV